MSEKLEAELYWEAKNRLEATRWLKCKVVSLQLFEFAAQLRDRENALFRKMGGEGNSPINVINRTKLSSLSNIVVEYILEYMDSFQKTYAGRLAEESLIVLKRDIRTECLLRG